MSQRKTYYVVTDAYGNTVAVTNKLKQVAVFMDGHPFGPDITIIRYTCDTADGSVVHCEVILDE